MNLSVKSFQATSSQEKLEFFVHTQRLLTTHHPESPFIFREDNVMERMEYVKNLSSRYQGFCYANDQVAILFNKIMVADIQDPVAALQNHKFKPAADPYNAVSIDFVVFRDIKDCLDFCQTQYDPFIKHVVYVKNGRPQIFETARLVSRIFNMPMARP
jgi:hypothetical protein